MNQDEFWTVVESVGWGERCKAEDASTRVEDRAYKVGKQILLGKLPTLEHSRVYDVHLSEVTGLLSAACYSWEEERSEQFPCGDDGFGDLLAHIVGLGREEYERNVADPGLAFERAANYDYEESFSYCTPHREDYDPLEIQTARAYGGLVHWEERLSDSPECSVSKSEVERRGREVAKLRERLAAEGGTEITLETYEAHLAAEAAAYEAEWRARQDRQAAKAAAKEKLLADFELEWA